MTEENTTSVTTDPAAPEKAPKKASEPKPEVKIFLGPLAARAESVYDRLRQVVRDNSGLTMSEMIQATIKSGFKAGNSTQFDAKPTSFLTGYSTGARKGFFSNTDGEHQYAVAAGVVRAASTKAPAKAKPILAEAPAALLNTVLSLVSASVSEGETVVGVGVDIKSVAEATGKPKNWTTKNLNKLVELGLAERDEVQSDGKPVEMVFLTTKGSEVLQELAKVTEAPTEDASEAEVTSGVTSEAEVAPESEGASEASSEAEPEEA
jgi:DNA-binding MarR family transcriptional regulator